MMNELENSANPVEDLSILISDLKRINILSIKEHFRSVFKIPSEEEKYERLAVLCKNKAILHPEWSLLSGRIKMRYYKKYVLPSSYSESTALLKSNLHPEYLEFVLKYSIELNSMIRPERDYRYDIFAVDTLLKSYLLRIKKDAKTTILETPQYLFMRVAVYLWYTLSSDEEQIKESLQHIQNTYEDLSMGRYIQASPTLFNAGTSKPQLSSCFTMVTDDNMQSITKSWKDAAFISMNSGGIGFDYSSLRHSEIGGFGQSGGIIPWIKVMNQILSTVDQCFTEDTIVYTVNKGPIPISEVVPGDVCIRKDGGCMNVMRNIIHPVSKLGTENGDRVELLTLETSSSELIVTSKHPIFGVFLPKTNSLEENVFALRRKHIIPSFIPANEIETDLFWVASPISQYEMDNSFYSREDCKMYGYFLKNGNFNYTHNTFTIRHNKPESKHWILNYFENRGMKPYVLCSTTSTFRISHLFTLTPNMFRADNRIFPPFLHLPLLKLEAIVEGMFMDLELKDGLRIKNVSKAVEAEMKWLCMRLKYFFMKVGEYYIISHTPINNSQFYEGGYLYSVVSKKAYSHSQKDYILYDLEMEHTIEDEELTANYLTSTGLVANGGKRKGAGACYMTEWHIDIEEFLELRKPSGAEEMRARDLFYALFLSDLFMKRVEADADWTLFCPHKTPGLEDKWGTEFEIEYAMFEEKAANGKISHFRKIKARELWKKIILTQIETGMPYILYKDAINRKSNQINLGITRLSNLCVSGDTYILTKEGQIPIRKLEGKKVEVWNGEEWSETTVFKTGKNKKLMNVQFTNGANLKCTPEHFFYIEKEGGTIHKIAAQDLKEGDRPISYSLPQPSIYSDNSLPSEKCFHPYTQGFFFGRGRYNKYKKPIVKLNATNAEMHILPQLSFEAFSTCEKRGITKVVLNDLHFIVPHCESLAVKLGWISGFISGCRKQTSSSYVVLYTSQQLQDQFRLLCQSIGVRIYKDRLGKDEIEQLMNMGMVLYGFETLKPICPLPPFENKIENTYFDASEEDTFCFMEPKRNMGMFNGILTGQCTEITLVSNTENIGSCNLGSICVNECVEGKTFNFERLEQLTRNMVRNINQVIDRNYYIDAIPEIKYTNLRNRPLGIGIQGLADAFALMDLSWISEEARKLNEMISETMYYAAVSESVEFAKKYGAYETFPGSPASKGLFQFDLWDLEILEKKFKDKMDVNPSIDIEFLKQNTTRRGPATNRYDWEELRSNMMKYGLRNSLLLAYMPTASTSNIMGNTECFEVPTQHIYSRTVLSGQYVITNRHLVRDLEELGLWNTEVVQTILKNGGSVQSIPNTLHPSIEKIKEKYLTAFEVPQRMLLDMALDRGRYICQSQSFNCWMKDPSYAKLNSFHFYGWKNGAKTGMYYLRQPAKVDPINFSLDTIQIPSSSEEPKCEMCSA